VGAWQTALTPSLQLLHQLHQLIPHRCRTPLLLLLLLLWLLLRWGWLLHALPEQVLEVGGQPEGLRLRLLLLLLLLR